MKPILSLKKPVKDAVNTNTASTPVVNVAKRKPSESKAPTPQDVKKEQSLLNFKTNEENRLQKLACVEKLKPIVKAYFEDSAIFSETVVVDEVECLRPLSIGVGYTSLKYLREQPDVIGCSTTVLRTLISLLLRTHVTNRKYLNGTVKFNNRFELNGNLAGEICMDHKKRAERLLQLEYNQLPSL